MAKDKKVEKKQTESMQAEAKSYAEAYADDRDLSVAEATAHLVVIGWKRLKALKKDNTRRAKGLKPQFRKVSVTTLKTKSDGASKPKKKAKKAKKAKKPAAASTANGAVQHASA